MVMDNASASIARQLHTTLLRVVHEVHAKERELAKLLAEMEAGQHFRQFGCTSRGEYAARELGLRRTKISALLAIGRALPDFPVLDAAMANGELSWTKAREIEKVLTADNEAEWVETAKACTNRELEQMTRHAARGEKPPEPGEELEGPMAEVRLRGATAEARKLREALLAMRAEMGPEADDLSDLQLLAQAAQRLLHDGKKEDPESAPTGARHQVVVHVCRDCRKVRGEGYEVEDTTVALACCDAEIVDLTDGPTRGNKTSAVKPSTRRAVHARDDHRCRVPWCTNTLWTDIHHIRPKSRGGGDGEVNLITLCSGHHTLLHDGSLGIDVQDGVLEFRFVDGRVVRRALDPDVPRGESAQRPGAVDPDAPGDGRRPTTKGLTS